MGRGGTLPGGIAISILGATSDDGRGGVFPNGVVDLARFHVDYLQRSRPVHVNPKLGSRRKVR